MIKYKGKKHIMIKKVKNYKKGIFVDGMILKKNNKKDSKLIEKLI